MNLPNVKAAQLVYPYMDEGYKLLTEKYKCGAHEANDLVRDYFNHIFYNWPRDLVMKNPRRVFLHGLRGLIEKRREEERKAAQYNQ
jgi:hypothetical protein